MAINIKPSHKGLLHKNLGVPQGRKIPASKLAVKSTDSEAVRKRKQFAINAKKWKHEDGGFIDNRSLPEFPDGGKIEYPKGGTKDPAKYHLIDGKWTKIFVGGGSKDSTDVYRPNIQGNTYRPAPQNFNVNTPDTFQIDPRTGKPTGYGALGEDIISSAIPYITGLGEMGSAAMAGKGLIRPAVNFATEQLIHHGGLAIGEHMLKEEPVVPQGNPYSYLTRPMTRMAKGGSTDAKGGSTDAIAPGLEIASGFAANSNNPMLQESLDYGAKGASMGSLFGPYGTVIGGAAGLVTGAIKGGIDANEQAIQKQKFDALKANNAAYAAQMGRPEESNYNIKTNQQALYGKGGVKIINQNQPNAQEEVEGGEAAQTPQGQNIQFNGPDHEEGGIKTNLPEGTRIFSDRLKMGKHTFAKLAKPIQNRIEKLEDRPKSKALENTKMFRATLFRQD